MKKSILMIAVFLLLIIADSTQAKDQRFPPRGAELLFQSGSSAILYGRTIGATKAVGDTIYLLGNPRNPNHVSPGGIGPQANGTFEDQFGNPGWFGWTHEDLTYNPEVYWHVSDFNAVSGNYSMWCGTTFDGDPGYGNGWLENLVYTHQVADNNVASTVNLAVTLQVDTEDGYDYVYVEYNADGIWTAWDSGIYDGRQTYFFNDSIVYQPGDYVGSGDEIQLRIRFESDGSWSDEDDLWDTNGACQIDDIEVHVGGVLVNSEDFEDGPDGTYDWIPVPLPGVGDYAALYTQLQELDPCQSNSSAMVAFVDDGVVVPGTGGSQCTTWCYGPGGYIVNNTGGLMGPDFSLDNVIISPPLEWPAGLGGASIVYDVYLHEAFTPNSGWPGVAAAVGIRSIASGNPADLDDAPLRRSGWVGGPVLETNIIRVSDLLEPGCTHVQMILGAYDYTSHDGIDGTPAPYFDNARLLAYPLSGPAIEGYRFALFSDNFPANGDLDLTNLGNNDVRLDAALNVAPHTELVIHPGDSIWCDITAVRAGSVLEGLPRLYARMKANPLFDDFRVLPPNFTQIGNIIEGWVSGDSTYWAGGALVEDRYNFDLPDEDFFFPGDVMNYYIEARDNQAGDIGITLLPGDTTGFHDLKHNLHYPVDFTVRALPSLFSASTGDQPRILFWQDSDLPLDSHWEDGESLNEWSFALSQLGFRMGVDYDMFFTHFPHLAYGHGLGSRATSALLDGYDTLLYTSGRLSNFTLSNGDFENDPSPDLPLLDNWFARGDKNAFMTGDFLVSDLINAGSLGQAFVNDYFNVNYVSGNLLNLVGHQTAPMVRASADNGVIARVPEWLGSASCPVSRTFDAIEANTGTIRLAEFTDINGNSGVYPYAAGSYYNNTTENSRVVLMPYDFTCIWNKPGWAPPDGYAGIPARAIILEDILDFFGNLSTSEPIGVPPAAVLTATCFPNPFNPTTTIKLTIPRTGDVSLKVFNIRGELVRTLVDGRLIAGTHDVVWDGKADQGNQVASGVYFYQTKAGGEERIGKLTLVK